MSETKTITNDRGRIVRAELRADHIRIELHEADGNGNNWYARVFWLTHMELRALAMLAEEDAP